MLKIRTMTKLTGDNVEDDEDDHGSCGGTEEEGDEVDEGQGRPAVQQQYQQDQPQAMAVHVGVGAVGSEDDQHGEGGDEVVEVVPDQRRRPEHAWTHPAHHLQVFGSHLRNERCVFVLFCFLSVQCPASIF